MRIRYLALLLFVGLTALFFAALPAASATTITGDLVITPGGSPDQRSDDVIDITGSIIIQNGASAQWINITVNFNSTSPAAHGLYIDGSADFSRVNITALPGTTRWWFLVNATGSLSAQSCDFGWMNGSATDPGAGGTAATTSFAGVAGGLQVLGGVASVGNSSIHDGRGANVYVAGGNARFDRDRIFDAHYAFTEYATSFSGGRQTSDFRGVAVCVMVGGGQADIDRNRIERCGAESSANITDLGSSNATTATSNMRLIGAGVVAIAGNQTFRQLDLSDVTQITSATRTLTVSGVVATHNLFKLASWGVLFKGTSGGEVAGNYIANADIGIEIWDDATYGGGALTYDLHGITFNGTYATGVQAYFGGFASSPTFLLGPATFATGGLAALNLQFASLSAAHFATIANVNADLNTVSGTGLNIYDYLSAGKPTVSISASTFARLRAPVSIGLQSLTGGASINVSGNIMDQTAGAQNGSASAPVNRGGIDIRWVSLSTGPVNIIVDANRVYNQTWNVGPYDGITLYSSGSSNLQTIIAVRGNDVSNVTSGIYLYESYGGGQNTAYNLSRNTVEVTTTYGIYLFDSSTGGNLDPAFDHNTIDRAGSNSNYAVYFYVSQANVLQRTFGNNTVYGTGLSRCCGMYFQYGNAVKWPLIIADTLITNTTTALNFQYVTASVFRSDLGGVNTGVQCSECNANLYETNIFTLSATVSGAQSYVINHLSFGAKRVQWQGDGGELIHDTVLKLNWAGPVGSQQLALFPVDSAGEVGNRSLPSWKRTSTVGETYANLTPAITVNFNEITGNVILFSFSFWGNVTIIDPGLPAIIAISPGANTQVRARTVKASGTISDALTGVGALRISTDNVNWEWVPLAGPEGGPWQFAVNFSGDGTFNITLRAWDVARFSITFGDYSSGYSELVISGITVDTVPPRVYITDPASDVTTRTKQYAVRGIVSDLNGIDTFQFTAGGAILPIQPDPIGNFVALVTGLSEGPNLISVLATDRAGNTNVSTRTIVVDTIPPVLNIYSPLNNSFTNRAALDLSGDVEEDVALTVNGVTASFPYTLPLRTGMNQIWVNATDHGGNVKAILLTVTLDRTPPTVTFTQPQRFPFYTRDPHVTIRGIANEPLGSLVVNDVTYPLNPQNPAAFSFELYLEDGSHDVLVSVTDLANNTLEVRASPLVVDTQAPTLRVDSPPDKSVQQARTVTFRGRTDPNAFLNVTGQAGRQAWDVNPVTGEFVFTDTRSSDGVFPYLFEASDAVGNTRSLTITVTVDTTRPNVEILSPPTNYDTTAQVVAFHGTVGRGSTLTLTVNSPDPALDVADQPVAVSCSEVEGSDCEYAFNLRVSDGQTTVSLVATDVAGNQQAREVFVKKSVNTQATPQDTGQNGWMIGLIGLAGLVAFPYWLKRYRAKANEAEPGLLENERPARSIMAAPPPPPQVVVHEEPQDMYASDAMARQPGRRPPRGG